MEGSQKNLITRCRDRLFGGLTMSWPAVILSGLIVGAILSQTVLLLQGIRIAHVPELIVLALALIVFRRKPKEFAVMTAAALLTAVAVQALLPVWG